MCPTSYIHSKYSGKGPPFGCFGRLELEQVVERSATHICMNKNVVDSSTSAHEYEPSHLGAHPSQNDVFNGLETYTFMNSINIWI